MTTWTTQQQEAWRLRNEIDSLRRQLDSLERRAAGRIQTSEDVAERRRLRAEIARREAMIAEEQAS